MVKKCLLVVAGSGYLRRAWVVRYFVVAGFSLRYIVVVISIMLYIGISNVEGVTRTWDGGGVDNNWSTPANWSGNTMPTDTTTVNITDTSNIRIRRTFTVGTGTVTGIGKIYLVDSCQV